MNKASSACAKKSSRCTTGFSNKMILLTGENLTFIEFADARSNKYGITMSHETHRDRFLFSPSTTKGYIENFSNLKLTADFSHWCVVSEPLLEKQQNIVDMIIPQYTYLGL